MDYVVLKGLFSFFEVGRYLSVLLERWHGENILNIAS